MKVTFGDLTGTGRSHWRRRHRTVQELVCEEPRRTVAAGLLRPLGSRTDRSRFRTGSGPLPSQGNQSMYVDIYIPEACRARHLHGHASPSRPAATRRRCQSSCTSTISRCRTRSVSDAELNSLQRPARSPRLPSARPPASPRLQSLGHPSATARVRAATCRCDWDDVRRLGRPAAVRRGVQEQSARRCAHAGDVPAVRGQLADAAQPGDLSLRRATGPARANPRQSLIDHYMTAPYIGDGLSQGYKDAFLAVQRQFVEHFARAGLEPDRDAAVLRRQEHASPRLRLQHVVDDR